MNSKDTLKIVAALVLIGAAVGLFAVRSRSAGDGDGSGDGEISHWYCVKTQKFFELRGEEADSRHKMVPRSQQPRADGAPKPRGNPNSLVTIAKSPYTDDWTGVPAEKCPQCGQVFLLDTDAESVCPKCRWNPSKKGASPHSGG